MIEMPRYKNPVSLIPGGCPQLLDYAAPFSILDSIKYSFEELGEKIAGGQKKIHLHAYRKNEEGEFVDEMDPGRLDNGTGYQLNGMKAIQPWLESWMPLPFLRVRGQGGGNEDCKFEYGPTDWARGRLCIDEQEPDFLRLVLAFDMHVEKRVDDVYAALTPEDVDANARFRLAWRFRDNAWFMDLGWIDDWLKEVWTAWQKKTRRRNNEWQLEYLASYLAFLEVINKISNNCEVYVIRPGVQGSVAVDLVLDIGNSRTTGILVETHAQSATNLNDSYLLQLRDMSRPENIYTDPFETRVEFSEITFGNDALSLHSGRQWQAFVWPSPVRIGPEAGRLATLSRCEKGSTGMSSPKRYLWDERDWKRSWRFNTTTEESPYVVRGPLASEINSSGTPLCCMEDKEFTKNPVLRAQDRESAFESEFTRSSLMMFLLVEIIQQALLTINSPGQRIRRDLPALPRRLRQIIFTVPGGMPIAEQKIYRRWANWAVHVLWEALGWGEYYTGTNPKNTCQDSCDYRTSPVVRCDWDEATCTQLVFIYNEISRKFQGDALLFCQLMGRERNIDGKKTPSVRVATIDIGGGTTDLSITTFELASDSGSTPRMAARPDFHDGFSLAGDDILRAVICDHVLTAIGGALANAGIPNTREALATLFGRDTMDSSKDMLSQRIQFIRQIAVPVCLCLLELYEKADTRKDAWPISIRMGDCFCHAKEAAEGGQKDDTSKKEAGFALFPMPSPAAVNYVRNYVADFGKEDDFNILDVQINVDARGVDDTVRSVLKDILANLCEVINLYDCDALLLTGRPSRWPGIVNTVFSLAPVPPARIFPMGDYKVGGWYPFSDPLGNMTDPKTTVVVGAILCALAEGQLEGFSFDSHRLSLYSTARYIGEMELDGQIRKDKVWFNVDPDNNTVNPDSAEIMFSGPMAVGFRQLEAERWTTTRFYFLEFANDAARVQNAGKLPLKVKMAFILPETDDTDSGRDEGEFEIQEITDRNGDSISTKALNMRLQTLPRNEGFWMDTGIVYED